MEWLQCKSLYTITLKKLFMEECKENKKNLKDFIPIYGFYKLAERKERDRDYVDHLAMYHTFFAVAGIAVASYGLEKLVKILG